MSVNVKYKNNSIAELADTGTKTLKTAGKYCEADIVVENTKDAGTTITDGIIVKSRDENGRITEVDYYKTDGIVNKREFATGGGDWPSLESSLGYLEKVNFKTPITEIKERAFENLSLQEIPDLSNVTTLGKEIFYRAKALTAVVLPPNIKSLPGGMFCACDGLISIDTSNIESVGANVFGGCSKLTELLLPKCTAVETTYYAGVFGNMSALTNLQIGSVGYGLSKAFSERNFNGNTQSGLTVTVFVKTDIVDTLVANIRNGATNATIVIKASEPVTYNDTEYAAGDTIITSTVETEGTT